MANQSYPNLTAFYGDNNRLRSSEADYGVWWLEGRGPGPWWRVAYVKNTGEVYAVETRNPGRVEILGVVPPDEGEIYYDTLDKILEGWSLVCGQEYGLRWIRRRLAELEQEAWGADADYQVLA